MAVNLYKKATQFGYKIALDEPHGGYSWHIHLLKMEKELMEFIFKLSNQFGIIKKNN